MALIPFAVINYGYSASRTHMPELLPVMLSHETHIHLVFLSISIGFLLSNTQNSNLPR